MVFVPESLDSIDELRPLLGAAGGARETAQPPVELQVVRMPDSAKPPAASGDAGLERS
jgi:hypothetical protein